MRGVWFVFGTAILIFIAAVKSVRADERPPVLRPTGETACESRGDTAATATQKTDRDREARSAAGARRGVPLISYYKEGFYLESEDKAFQLRIRGNIHVDFRSFDSGSGAPNSFDIRRCRIDLMGVAYKYYSFRIQLETADSPYIRNAWVDLCYVPWLHIRLGQMKPPFSTLWWTMDNNVNFYERATSTPLYPFFDRGAWIWGPLFHNTLTWNASVWNGSGIEPDYKKGDIDDHKDMIGRLFWSPFKNSGNKYVNDLHLCIQGSYGAQSVPTTRFENALRAPDYMSNYWTWKDKTMSIGSRTRYGAELNWIAGPFAASTEWIELRYDDMIDYEGAYRDFCGAITCWTVWSSLSLTGEKKSTGNFGWRTPAPKKNFDPAAGTWGAWEILARYSSTVTDKAFFQKGVLSGASWVDEYTAGLNWTLNPMARVQLNYVFLNSDGLLSGANSDQWNAALRGKVRAKEQSFLFRFIFMI
jgi:phosphate-selective porin OprO/OprP